MLYNSGDIINQECTDCGKLFDYVYPGGGRPRGHRCPSCFSLARRTPVGTELYAFCKDCGKEFQYLSTVGRGPERCESCRPTKRGSTVLDTCSNCGVSFFYTFTGYYYTHCPDCRKSQNKERLTNWARKKRGNTPRGTVISGICKICGKEFTYTSFGKARNLCGNHYAETNLSILERQTQVENQWTWKKWKLTRDAFGNRCAYCDREVKVSSFHRDHFIPKSLGGISDIGNIVPSCPTCNLRKSAKHPKDFLSPEKYSSIIVTLSKLAKLG